MQSTLELETRNIFWDNGRLKRSIQFLNGIRSGADRMWNEEGLLVDEGFYEAGKPIGAHRRWGENGRLIEEILYRSEKQFDFRSWDEKGDLRCEAFWIDENRYLEKTYDSLQNLWVEKKGNWDGKQIVFENDSPFCVFPEVSLESILGDFSKSYALFMERFPKMAFSISEWTYKEVLPESISHCKVGKAEAIYIYGLGCGAPYFQLQKWLREDPNRVLIFLEDDIQVLSYFLQLQLSIDILSDLQVHVEFLNRNEDEIKSLAEKFNFHRIEIFAIPSKQGKFFETLKLQIFRKTTLSHAIQMDRVHGYYPFENFVKNAFRMPKSFYANGLKNAFKGLPAIVCGAGPSLNEAIPLLKTLSDKAILIAGGSTLAALSSKGVPIHFGVAIDPNLEEYRRLKNSFALETPILYSTRVHPSLFQTCNGPFGYMRSGIGGILEVWMEEALQITDSMIGEKLSSESLSVTTICTAWAEFIGCKTILFCGVDLSYSEQRRYAEGVGCEDDFSFSELDAENSAADRILRKKDNRGRPVYTATRWVMEAAALGDYAKKHKKISFFNTSEAGLKIPGVPFLSLSEISETILNKSYDIESMVREKIVSSPMPENTLQIIEEKLQELGKSIEKVVEYLEIITKKKSGSSALAEMELDEELSLDLIFYDAMDRFGKLSERKGALWKDSRWERFLELARKYQKVMAFHKF